MLNQPCKEAFEELRRRLTTSLIMQPLDWELSFEFMCDASNYALGVMLINYHMSLLMPYAL